METILPYTIPTKLTIEQFQRHVPFYAKVTYRTSLELIFETLPLYLHGSRGVIDMIRRYIGFNETWVKVDVYIPELIRNRDRDVFFVYLVLSNIEPVRLHIPSTIVLKNKINTDPLPEHASKRIPFIFDENNNIMYYRTRTGHLGTYDELLHIESGISIQGSLTTICPSIQMIRDSTRARTCLIIVDKNDVCSRKYWENENICGIFDVLHITDGTNIPEDIRFDVVVLDNVYVYQAEPIQYYSEDNDVRGRIHETNISKRLFHTKSSIFIQIISNSDPTMEQIISCLYLFNVQRNNCSIIDIDNNGTYHIHRHLLTRLIENLVS